VLLKPGARLRSIGGTVEIIVVRAAPADISITCSGQPMVAEADADRETRDATGETPAGAVELGKRYADDELGLEVLCTKAGKGELAANGRVMTKKEARPLPASDLFARLYFRGSRL
jgi:hypothetical protein